MENQHNGFSINLTLYLIKKVLKLLYRIYVLCFSTIIIPWIFHAPPGARGDGKVLNIPNALKALSTIG